MSIKTTGPLLSGPVKALCVSGAVQYAPSKDALMREYNRYGRLYDLVGDEIWHRGYKRLVARLVAHGGRLMTSHPNRGRGNPASNPTPAEIKEARLDAGLTQTQAASLIHASLRAWQQWEAGDRRMHPAMWELFTIKVDRRER